MELEVLKKKLSTYKTARGSIRNVSDELLLEVLGAWEQWTGPTSGFCSSIGVSRKGISSMIGKAKRLKREGYGESSFKEIKLATSIEATGVASSSGMGITIRWKNGQIIKFSQVCQLVEFLNTMENQEAA